MSTTVEAGNAPITEEVADATPVDDERLAYRSIFQRLFVRPEVGAIIGAIGIWSFFWAVSEKFGTAGQTFGWLDIASTLGIMAVAVSMLMIGGEFDLSAGAMTGAMAMLVVFMVKETGEEGGLGLPMTIVLPATLVVALAIGWLNGWMVERTGQPSFIITLATFFSLKGLKLGLANRFVGQIQVASTDEASDYEFWRPFFASEWQRNDHQLEIRDFFYIVLPSLGVALLILAICELWFERRETLEASGLVQFVVGAALGVAGGIALHATDGSAVNAVIAAVIGVGLLVGLHGWCRWRYEPIADRGSFGLNPILVRRMAIGVGALAVAAVAAVIIDSTADEELLFPFTTQGIRAILYVGLTALGITFLALASHAALSVSPATKFAVTSALALAVAFVAGTIFFESESAKFRAALFSILLFAAATVFAWGVVVSRFSERRRPERDADRMGNRLILIGFVSILVGLAFRLLFTVEAEIEAGISPAKTSIRLFWFVLFAAVMVWVLGNTKFGSWTYAVGGNKEAARQIGVPAARTKTQLFMLVAAAAWLVGVLLAFRINSIQANTGDGEEFEYIIAAVVGGSLLTGGYGTAFGGAMGAAIMAMPLIGISLARWNTDWRFLFLGVILAIAVVANRYIRTKAEGIRR